MTGFEKRRFRVGRLYGNSGKIEHGLPSTLYDGARACVRRNSHSREQNEFGVLIPLKGYTLNCMYLSGNVHEHVRPGGLAA